GSLCARGSRGAGPGARADDPVRRPRDDRGGQSRREQPRCRQRHPFLPLAPDRARDRAAQRAARRRHRSL
ncbi:MAG: hypothetical protein AVDCRST_MAG23-148, partial [uncultured Sphingosinicella sp.]